MRNTTTKRVWMAAVALTISAALGACADEPMAPQEEGYEVMMDETDTTTQSVENCVIINGQTYCKG